MSEIHHVRHILKGTTSDIIVLAVTFFLTVFADLTVAVEFGLLMAAVLFIKRMSDVHRVERVLPDVEDPKQKVRPVAESDRHCPQATILNVEGALFFGAAQKFETEVVSHLSSTRTLLIRLGKVPVIDASGERALFTIWEACQKRRIRLLISGLQPQPAEVLESTGLLDSIGRDSIFPHTGAAIDMAVSRMDIAICATCPYSAFQECTELKQRGLLDAADHRKEI